MSSTSYTMYFPGDWIITVYSDDHCDCLYGGKRWDNVWLGDGDLEEVRMNLDIDQTHTSKRIRYMVPMSVIDRMCNHDSTPGNEEWWTLDLSLEVVIS